jgi:nucleotide-binding universal stress UspA family protein
VEEEEMVKRILDHIDKKREALGLPVYEPEKHGQSGDARMHELLELAPEERAEALYGMPAGD